MKKILVLFSFSLLVLQNKTNAQTDSTVMYVTGEGLSFNLGKGDGTKINLLTTVQTGLQINKFDSSIVSLNSNRFSLNLVRISLTASTFKNKATMGLVTDFTGNSPILEGWVGLSVLNKRAKLFLGQRQTHTNNRLAMADERYAQVMSQSIAGKSSDGIIYGGLMQNFVGSTREGGVFFESNFKIGKMRIYPSVSITTGEGQNFFNPQTNTGFKYGGRIDLLPLGDFIKNNAFIAHDLYRERKPKLAFGFAASLNVKATSPIGSDNAVITSIYNKTGVADFANYRKIVADFIFKSNGFALVGEYINGTVSGTDLYTNVAGTIKLTEQVASSYYNIGSAFNIQSSYVFKNGWAIDGRYAVVSPEFQIANSLVRKQNWLTFGINKFIKNNAVKLGINTSFIEDSTPTITTKRMVNNLAIQILL